MSLPQILWLNDAELICLYFFRGGVLWQQAKPTLEHMAHPTMLNPTKTYCPAHNTDPCFFWVLVGLIFPFVSFMLFEFSEDDSRIFAFLKHLVFVFFAVFGYKLCYKHFLLSYIYLYIYDCAVNSTKYTHFTLSRCGSKCRFSSQGKQNLCLISSRDAVCTVVFFRSL